MRTAYQRLHSRVQAEAGGTAALGQLVTSAYRAAVDGGRSARADDFDPYAILGVEPRTPDDVVRGAFRRLVQLVHPDRGGTDELFRVVATSYDLVTDPLARVERETGVRYRPPPPPPPPGPFERRPAEDRRYEPAWRSWMTIGGGVAVLLAGGFVLAAFIVAMSNVKADGAVALVLIVTVGALVGARPAYAAIARGVAQLRARRIFASSEDLDDFLLERCLDAPVGRERDDVLYYAYRGWCIQRRRQVVSMRSFVEYLRSLGILYVNASAWDNGVLVGIRLRDD